MDTSHYRKDIDFLRAISVLAVVVFHAFPSALPGGFTGVDIFFVISGYLITGKIVKSIQSGTFSFSDFYQGRAYRLLPTLFVVILFSSIAGLFYSLPDRYNDLIEAGILSLIYAGNTFFANNGDYFSTDHSQHPLLHLWSLSVEEQFYFIWPLALILISYWQKYILLIIATAILGFVWLAESNNQSSSSYFLLQYRAFELLIGALCSQIPHKHINQVLASIVTTLSLIAMSLSFWLLGAGEQHPGIISLYPTIAAACFLYFAPYSHKHIKYLLHQKQLITIGLISYSMYLWHWPLLVFGKKSGTLDNSLSYMGYFLALCIVSYISWKFIEQKYRYNKKTLTLSEFSLKRLLPTTLLYAAFLSLLFESGFQKVLWENFWGDKAKIYYNIHNDRQMIVNKYCHERPKDDVHTIDNSQCRIGMTNEKTTMLAIGDSHAEHFARLFDRIAKEYNTSAQLITRSACLPLIDTPISLYKDLSLIDEKCTLKNEKWYKTILTDNIETVFIAAYWSAYIDKELTEFPSPPALINANDKLTAFRHGLDNTLEFLLSKNVKVFLMAQVPEFSYPIEQCVFDSIMSNKNEMSCTESRSKIMSKHQDYLDIFSDITKEGLNNCQFSPASA